MKVLHILNLLISLFPDTPLDLSRSLLSSRVPVMTLDVPQPARTLMTPPSEPEERRSVSSDGLSPSDEVSVLMVQLFVLMDYSGPRGCVARRPSSIAKL